MSGGSFALWNQKGLLWISGSRESGRIAPSALDLAKNAKWLIFGHFKEEAATSTGYVLDRSVLHSPSPPSCCCQWATNVKLDTSTTFLSVSSNHRLMLQARVYKPNDSVRRSKSALWLVAQRRPAAWRIPTINSLSHRFHQRGRQRGRLITLKHVGNGQLRCESQFKRSVGLNPLGCHHHSTEGDADSGLFCVEVVRLPCACANLSSNCDFSVGVNVKDYLFHWIKTKASY